MQSAWLGGQRAHRRKGSLSQRCLIVCAAAATGRLLSTEVLLPPLRPPVVYRGASDAVVSTRCRGAAPFGRGKRQVDGVRCWSGV